ncbi:MAG: hypothetical protein ACLQG3_09590 [Terracidiphilus sp.]
MARLAVSLIVIAMLACPPLRSIDITVPSNICPLCSAPQAGKTASRTAWLDSGIGGAGLRSWIALFTAAQNGDGAAMTTALRQPDPILQQ